MKRTRRVVQAGFLVLTLVGVFVVKGNAERWCPFGGVEALYLYFNKGQMLCSLGVSNFYILGAVLLLAILLRRVFCGYMCPIGAISEWLGAAARRLGWRPRRVPTGADQALSLLKYGVLALILWVTWRADELLFRTADPCYALISRHGEDITFWAYVVSGAIVLGSLLVTIPFCRWLCPLGAVFNPFSRFGLARVKRSEPACSGCGKCARICPMAIPVDDVQQVTAARCMSCLDCVAACPELKAGALTWGPPNWLGRSWSQRVLLTVMLAVVACAVAGASAFPLPSYVSERGQRPAAVASLDLKVHDLTCRGRATLFTELFLYRDDELALPGYVRVEAWPRPGIAHARIIYDPARTDEKSIRRAITEAYYDPSNDAWTVSPFTLEGDQADDTLGSEPAF